MKYADSRWTTCQKISTPGVISKMNPRQYLFSSLLILLALMLVFTPVSAASTDGSYGPGELAIRQAHLAWNAYITEVEMNAAVTYLSPLYGTDTTLLKNLLEDFREKEAQIPAISTKTEYTNLTGQMRGLASQFRDETATQLALGQGKTDALQLMIITAKTNNPYIEEKKNAYWSLRKSTQLKDFDSWALSSQASLDILKKGGYDTAAAQRTLDVIESKRPDLLAALESRSETAIITVNTVIQPLSQQLATQTQEVQGQVSEKERIQYLLDQAYRAVYRADMLNNDLVPILLDIGQPEPILKKTKTDLAETRLMLATGSIPNTKVPLLLVKKDFKDLSTAYREIGITTNLPPDVSANLKSLVLVLDTTADQMDVSG